MEVFNSGEPPYKLAQILLLFNQIKFNEWMAVAPNRDPTNFKPRGHQTVRRAVQSLVRERKLFEVARRQDGIFYSHKPVAPSKTNPKESLGISIPYGHEQLKPMMFLQKVFEKEPSAILDKDISQLIQIALLQT